VLLCVFAGAAFAEPAKSIDDVTNLAGDEKL